MYKPAFTSVLKTVVLITALLTLSDCKRHKVGDAFNPAFTEKITAFTSGVISSESTIRIILAEDNPHAGEANTPVGKDLIKFKPAIKGQAVWVDKRTLEYRPSEKLKSGTTYHARFSLGKIVKVKKYLSVFAFDFTIVAQAWTVSIDGYQTHNENDLIWNRIKGVVNTADNIDYEQIKKYFQAIQGNKKLNISWEPGNDRRNFNFTVDSVRRTEKEGKVIISWDASPDYPDIKGTRESIIPSLADYKVLDVKVIHQPDQYIQIMFSDPIKKNQSFDGLIYLDSGTTLEYNVTGNIILAFPATRQSGNAQLTIQAGLKNILGYEMKQPYVADLTFEVPKPGLRLTGKGVILPSSKGMVFPFEAVNLSAVDVKIIKIYENNIGHFLQVNKLDGNNQLKRAGRLIHKEKISLDLTPANLTKWNKFYVDLAKLIEPDQGAIYRIELSFKKAYSLYPCEGESNEENGEEAKESSDDEDMDSEVSYWDSYEDYYDEYYEGDYEYEWENRDNPCSSSYYTQSRFVARNILASDLGIIAKAGTDQSLFCAVTSLLSSGPMEGVEVTLYNYQQQPIGKGVTDNSGFVTIEYIEKPFLLIARFEKQRGYLRLDDGSSLSLGAFDVSGKTIPKGIKAFLYGERGVWRPGDTLFLTCILEDKQKILPANHPVIFELVNPKGQLYAKTTRVGGHSGFYTWAVNTSTDALTGDYNLRVKVGGTQFNKTLKIESIKPNRLKINLQFNTSRLTTTKPDVKGDMTVTWLHGAVATHLKSVVTVNLTNAPTTFSKYANYQFTDPAKKFDTDEQTIFNDFTNESGKAIVPGHFTIDQNAPGMLMANFTTRVFEKSGDFSIDRFSIPYSPYTAYIGLKTPEGDKRGMLLTDTTQWVDVVLMDESGVPLSRNNLEAYVYKLYWRNWWESTDNELADYIGNTYNKPLVNKRFSVLHGKGKFGFRIDRPEWGRFYVRVVDPVSGHSAGRIVYIDWPGWAGRPMRDNPEATSMLTFNTDKQKYIVGETAEVTIPTSGKGNALFCIETGSRIVKKEWLKIEGKEIKHRFLITADMTPNVYLHISLIQPHANSENDMPMRLYGVVPIFVEDPTTRLTPVIKMPESLEPLKRYSIMVSEKNQRDMTYTLAVVEEGLLDLTRFKTPDPWEEFYAREALGIKTWDIYDMVIGAYGGRLASILGIGGDESKQNSESAEKANRFKPVVKFLGPFTLKGGKTNTHYLLMPNYIGSVRAMVIAGQNRAYGIAEKAVPVKKPLMVLATLPRVLGPGESVKLPVTVFAMDKQVRQVSVSIKTNSLLTSGGATTQLVSFDQTGEKIVAFDLKVARKTGVGRVQVIATSGKNSSEYDLELNVRNANPPVTTFVGDVVEQGMSKELIYTLPGVPGSNSVTLEISGIPPLDADKRLKYLIGYPHGCIEQTTSSVFAQLFLNDLVELDERTKSQINEHIKAGIRRIQTFQVSGGAFSYWPGESDYNSWGTSYAGHFLIEAEKKGYAVPTALKSAWIRAQKQMARQWTTTQNKDPYYQGDLEQAYRLFTLALDGQPELAAMNRLRENKNLSVQAKWRLAAAYALSGQVNIAKELINRETIEIQQYNGMYSSYGSRERDWAMLLETMVLTNNRTQGAILTKKISEVLSSTLWMSTQSTAYCLMAVAKFSKDITSSEVNFSYHTANGKVINITSQKPLVQISLPAGNAKNGTVSISNRGKGSLFTRVIMEGIPAAGEENEFNNNLHLEVAYYTPEGEALNISSLSQATDFMAIVSVYNPSAINYKDIALTQIFPPGWEISNSRLAENELAQNKDIPTYQDIRDDRIYTYFDLRKNEKKTFVVKLNASYLGRYYLTGAYCEAMYDNNISALKKGQWIEVKNSGE
jgi:alpha-2-macroglobulin